MFTYSPVSVLRYTGGVIRASFMTLISEMRRKSLIQKLDRMQFRNRRGRVLQFSEKVGKALAAAVKCVPSILVLRMVCLETCG